MAPTISRSSRSYRLELIDKIKQLICKYFPHTYCSSTPVTSDEKAVFVVNKRRRIKLFSAQTSEQIITVTVPKFQKRVKSNVWPPIEIMVHIKSAYKPTNGLVSEYVSRHLGTYYKPENVNIIKDF